MNEPMTLNGKAVAELLGMSPARLRREVAAGTVPGPINLVGKRRLWSRILLERWLAGEAAVDGARDPTMAAIEAAIATADQGASRRPGREA